MKQATLIYEPSLPGYSLKFDYDKNMVEFFKKTIPAHDRTTSGPPTWTWYFDSKYYDVIVLLFENYKDKWHRTVYKLTKVSEEEVRRVQQEQEAARQSWNPSTRQYSIDDELRRFYDLVPHNGTSFDAVRNMTQDEAKRLYRKGAFVYHPDRNAGSLAAAGKMSELNEVWNLLKEVYYTK